MFRALSLDSQLAPGDRRHAGEIDPELQAVLNDLANGRLALVLDEVRDRGDLVAVARLLTADAVNSMTRHGRGLVSAAITPEQRDLLDLPVMPGSATALASVEASTGVDTGISAADRALTIRTLADPSSTPQALVCPGHVVPLVAAAGGLLSRSGRIEAAVDVARLADSPAAAICEVLDEDSGDLAGADQVRALGERIGIPVTTVAELTAARIERAADGW